MKPGTLDCPCSGLMGWGGGGHYMGPSDDPYIRFVVLNMSIYRGTNKVVRVESDELGSL